ncbi:MAG: ABC transporter permease [Actinomycetales bacterium]
MSGHNLRTVISFEVIRTLRKPVFWFVTLAVPVLIAALAGLSVFSSFSAEGQAAEQSKKITDWLYTDDSGLISPDLAAERGGTATGDPQQGIEAVQTGQAQMYAHFPADPAKDTIEVWGQDQGVLNNGAYSEFATSVLHDSVTQLVDSRVGGDELTTLLEQDPQISLTAFADGVESAGFQGFVPPLMFLVLFFMAVTMVGNQMLNITVEEKENRVTEMILTTVGSTTLIVGKVIAVYIIGLIQAGVFLLPGAVVAGVAIATLPPDQAPVLDPVRLGIGFALFIAGFAMFTGMLICLGSILPNAKEAGGAFAAVVILLFLPLYTLTLVLADPEGIASRVLTYFPLTAPMTAMLRNAAGSLPVGQALAVLAILTVCAVGFLWLGSRLFATGSLSYDQRLKLDTLRNAVTRHPAGDQS